jgi:hypothetical protein
MVELGQAELPATGCAGSRLRTEFTGVQCEAPCDRAWELADGVGGGRAIPTARGRVQELLPSRLAHEREALTCSCFWDFFDVAIIVYRCCNDVLGMLQTLVFTM